jgi:hypothetical protein
MPVHANHKMKHLMIIPSFWGQQLLYLIAQLSIQRWWNVCVWFEPALESGCLIKMYLECRHEIPFFSLMCYFLCPAKQLLYLKSNSLLLVLVHVLYVGSWTFPRSTRFYLVSAKYHSSRHWTGRDLSFFSLGMINPIKRQ